MRNARLFAALSLAVAAAALVGCQSRNLSERSQSADPPAMETSQAPPNESERAEALTGESPVAFYRTENISTASSLQNIDLLTAGQVDSAVLVSEPSSLTLTFSQAQEMNCLRLSSNPGTKLDITIAAGDSILYEGKNLDAGERICRFDLVEASALTVSLSPLFEQALSLTAIEAGLLAGGVDASAYLPATTAPEALEQYASSLEKLGRVNVITGICWDENGAVVETSESYAPLMRALGDKKAGSHFQLFSTIYPQSALVKAGKAGQTLDTPENRAALTEALVAHANEYALDGIDFDWESQKDEAEWQNFSLFLVEAAPVLRQNQLLLSAAFYPDSIANLSPEAIAALDTLNLMAYDLFDGEGRHATYSSAAEALDTALAAGAAPAQVALGIPSYGRPLDKSAKWPLYNEQNLAYNEDYTDTAYFNSPLMVRDKCALADLSRLQGVFLYHLLGDFPLGQPRSLLGAVD